MRCQPSLPRPHPRPTSAASRLAQLRRALPPRARAHHAPVQLLEGLHLVRLKEPAEVEGAHRAVRLGLVPRHVPRALEAADLRGGLGLVAGFPVEGKEVDNLDRRRIRTRKFNRRRKFNRNETKRLRKSPQSYSACQKMP